MDAALSAIASAMPTTDHAARYYKFESISLQERVCKLSVPRAPIAGARGFDPMAVPWG